MSQGGRRVEFVVVGGGPGGCAIAGRLAEAGFGVLLIEAGPDFGRPDSGLWPDLFLQPTQMPVELHSWGYTNSGVNGPPNMPMQRARAIGGCSSHNGCAVVWGHRSDYDGWEKAGATGWNTNDFAPFFRKASDRYRVYTPERADVTPFHQAILETAPFVGLPPIENFEDFDITHGFGTGPVNISDRIRWNSAFAYIDPVRDLPNFELMPDTLVDRVLLERGRAVGVQVIGPNGPEKIEAQTVVLAGGAYGSPLLLQRSGIGDPSDLEAAGIAVEHVLPGVGKNLRDHPAIAVTFSGTPELTAQLDRFVADGGLPREEGTIALTKSTMCEGPFDLHLYPVSHRNGEGDWAITIAAAVMCAKSAGTIRATSTDPEAAPLIDHGYLTDADGYDVGALADAVMQIRQLAAQEPVRSLIGSETGPVVGATSREALIAGLPPVIGHDYHPGGTCKMGRVVDPMAVVNEYGRVYGLSDLYVGDASIMPNVPRANTNLPALAVGEKIAAGLIGH